MPRRKRYKIKCVPVDKPPGRGPYAPREPEVKALIAKVTALVSIVRVQKISRNLTKHKKRRGKIYLLSDDISKPGAPVYFLIIVSRRNSNNDLNWVSDGSRMWFAWRPGWEWAVTNLEDREIDGLPRVKGKCYQVGNWVPKGFISYPTREEFLESKKAAREAMKRYAEDK